MAIEQGLTVLSWYENLPKNEVPPEHLWEDVEGLELWWASVEEKRSDGSPDTIERPDSGSEDEGSSSSGSGMAKNDLARYLKD